MRTPYGVLQWRADAQPNTWRAVCAPCSVRSAELGHDAVQLTRVEFSVRRGGQSDMQGEFALGDAPRMVRGRWSAHLDAKGAELKFNLPDTPIADAYALFASAIPELSRARIDGRIHGDARLRLPAREWTIHPHVDGFAVAGLGTEALLDAVPTCNGKASTLKFGSWLPRAVIAAEDQRFGRFQIQMQRIKIGKLRRPKLRVIHQLRKSKQLFPQPLLYRRLLPQIPALRINAARVSATFLGQTGWCGSPVNVKETICPAASAGPLATMNVSP